MASRGKSARTKGHSFERKIAIEFRELGWKDAKRHQEYQFQEALEGRDLDNTSPFIVQTKSRQQYVSVTTIKEVKLIKGQYPLLITKANQKPVVAIMYWEDLKEILQMLKTNKIL